MQFMISQGHTKRRLEGDFYLCASKADIEHLIQELKRVLPNWSYGWLKICEPSPNIPFPPSGPPEPWESEEMDKDTNVTVTVQTGEDFLRKHLIPKRFREYMRDFVGRRCMP